MTAANYLEGSTGDLRMAVWALSAFADCARVIVVVMSDGEHVDKQIVGSTGERALRMCPT